MAPRGRGTPRVWLISECLRSESVFVRFARMRSLGANTILGADLIVGCFYNIYVFHTVSLATLYLLAFENESL